MVCPVSATIISSNIPSCRTFENRDSKLVQPEERNFIEIDLTAIKRSDDKKGLQSRYFERLSNIVHNTTIIETTMFLAIVGLVCSAVSSVLLPALCFAAVAAGTCILKNRVIQLDPKTLKDADVAFRGVLDQGLVRSASTVSQTRQANSLEGIMTREQPCRSTTTIPSMPIIKEIAQEKDPIDVKEAFLTSLGARSKLDIPQRYDLLTICYFHLIKKIADMPPYLKKEAAFMGKRLTEEYFHDKYQKTYNKASLDLKNSIERDGKRQTLQINDKQNLEQAYPSLIMEIVQELYQQISQEYNKYGSKTEAERYADNAKHARAYIQQLKDYELLKTTCSLNRKHVD